MLDTDTLALKMRHYSRCSQMRLPTEVRAPAVPNARTLHQTGEPWMKRMLMQTESWKWGERLTGFLLSLLDVLQQEEQLWLLWMTGGADVQLSLLDECWSVDVDQTELRPSLPDWSPRLAKRPPCSPTPSARLHVSSFGKRHRELPEECSSLKTPAAARWRPGRTPDTPSVPIYPESTTEKEHHHYC